MHKYLNIQNNYTQHTHTDIMNPESTESRSSVAWGTQRWTWFVFIQI